MHADLRQIRLAPLSEILQKNVAKSAGGDASCLMDPQAGGHFLLIFLIGTALADKDLLQRQPRGGGLLLQQGHTYAMHGDTLEMLIAGRE